MTRWRMRVKTGGGGSSSDDTPNQFHFTDLADQAVSTAITGDPVTITGINVSVAFTVTGDGAVQKNGTGSFVTSGTVVNNDTLTPKLTTGSGFSDQFDLILTINGVTDTWTVGTLADPDTEYAPGVIAAGLEHIIDYDDNGLVGLSGSVSNRGTPYLVTQGAIIDFISPSVYFGFTEQDYVVDDFDFEALGKLVYIDVAPGFSLTFNNCRFGPNSTCYVNRRPGNNTAIYPLSKVIFNHLELDDGLINMDEGDIEVYDFRFKNSTTSHYILAGGGTTAVRKIKLRRGYVDMTTGDPPGANPHLEFHQGGGSQSGFTDIEDVCFDVEKTIGTIYTGFAGWTGVISIGHPLRLKNVIFKGVQAVNEWGETIPTAPEHRCAGSVAYNFGAEPQCDNVVFGGDTLGKRIWNQSDAPNNVNEAVALTTCYVYETGAPLDTAALNA